MKIEKVFSISRLDSNTEERFAGGLTPDQRVSLLEDLRREMCRVQNIEYPQRMERVFEIFKPGWIKKPKLP